MEISSGIAATSIAAYASAFSPAVMASQPSVPEVEPVSNTESEETGDQASGNPALAPDGAARTPDSAKEQTEGDEQDATSTPAETFNVSPEEQRFIQKLRQRDLEVRAHEQAHLAAGGQYVTGGPSYDYQTGPDGRQYAIGGEVNIDTSPVPGDPEATADKARTLLRAALAPAEPSGQDQRVAAAARSMEIEASAETLELQQQEREQPAEAAMESAEGSVRGAEEEGAVDVQSQEQSADADMTQSDSQPSAPAPEGRVRGGADAARAVQSLDARIANFFAAPLTIGLSQFA